MVAKKRARRRKLCPNAVETDAESSRAETSIKDLDQFEVEDDADVEVDAVSEGTATVQDLLSVIKQAGLDEALPQALTLIELASTTPLTSVHCEWVFSKMKRVVSPARSTMNQIRKENLTLTGRASFITMACQTKFC